MKTNKIIIASMAAALIAVPTSNALAFSAHTSVHVTPHVSTPHISTPHVSTPHATSPHVSSPKVSTPKVSSGGHTSYKSSGSIKSNSGSKSTAKPSTKSSAKSNTSTKVTPKDTKPVTVSGEKVFKNNSNNTIRTSDSPITMQPNFYNKYQPHYSSQSWFTWMWLSTFNSHRVNNVDSITGKIVSKDGDNKVTIKTKHTGKVQVTLDAARYAKVKVGQTITVK